MTTRPPSPRATLPFRLTILSAALLSLHVLADDDDEARPHRLEAIEVVGTMPLPGIGLPLESVPANVQTIPDARLEAEKSLTIGDALERNTSGVNVNEAQSNPFQPDVNFRGFTASPLLGTPQGLSVYVDGVRVNEGFGDVVNWDLIPLSAVKSVEVIPGANPLFGLNTLGGALAVHTKSGFDHPGAEIEVLGGDWDRRAAEFEVGGHDESRHYFLSGEWFKDRGWRDHQGSEVRQLFAKTGYRDGTDRIDVSGTLADNVLNGALPLPKSWLGYPKDAYNYPEFNINKVASLAVTGTHDLGSDRILLGNVYYRSLRTESFASDINQDFVAFPDLPAENNATDTRQDAYGASLQWSSLRDLAGFRNQLSIGGTADLGRAEYSRHSQDADFTPDRGSLLNPSEWTLVHDVAGYNKYYGLYATDTFQPNDRWAITVAGRYNTAKIDLEDRSGAEPDLFGSHTYRRFNPSVGATYTPWSRTTFYAAYNEGMRAPNPAELTCADPNVPCKLPTNFLSDPDLKPVIAKNWELGARIPVAAGMRATASLFRTDLYDDIRFVSASALGNTGYFVNVARTRRQGIELAFDAELDSFRASLRYSFVDATFRSPFDENSPNNSTADPATGDIHVRPGDRIPGIPRHTVRLRLEYLGVSQLALGGTVVGASSQFVRGDENNSDAGGAIPGYAVLNLDATYRLNRAWTVFGKVDNAFDKSYANFGLLSLNQFVGPGRSFVSEAQGVPEQFVSPGAPRGVWVGLRYRWR